MYSPYCGTSNSDEMSFVESVESLSRIIIIS